MRSRVYGRRDHRHARHFASDRLEIFDGQSVGAAVASTAAHAADVLRAGADEEQDWCRYFRSVPGRKPDAPCPMLTIAITAETPMMMPSMVRAARILLRTRARKATRMIISRFMIYFRCYPALPRSVLLLLVIIVIIRSRASSSILPPRRAVLQSDSPLLILPSLKTTTRCAYCAMSGSCVTSTSVIPRSRFSR